jgi:hypothetical protein
MTGGFDVRGADELRRTLARAGDELGDLSAVNRRVGDLVAGQARALAPHRSGQLAGTVRATAAAAVVNLTATAPYAGPIHWGWPARGIPAQPFLSDAATRTEPTWVGFYFDELVDVLAKVEGA